MVHQTYADDQRLPTTIASATEHSDPSEQERNLSSITAVPSSDGIQAIWTTIQKQGSLGEAADITLKSWRPGTRKQYRLYIRKWIQHCLQRSIDPTNATVGQALQFLLGLFKKELGYSALNTARSALSCSIQPKKMVSFGFQPLVARFRKGVYECRPSLPWYGEKRDVKVALQFCASSFVWLPIDKTLWHKRVGF